MAEPVEEDLVTIQAGLVYAQLAQSQAALAAQAMQDGAVNSYLTLVSSMRAYQRKAEHCIALVGRKVE